MLAKKKENVSRSAAALTSKTPFQIVEAYKAIRANLLFMLSTAAEKAVVVTSAEPSAGKSTTCSNLAITMAQTGAKVVTWTPICASQFCTRFSASATTTACPSCSAA